MRISMARPAVRTHKPGARRMLQAAAVCAVGLALLTGAPAQARQLGEGEGDLLALHHEVLVRSAFADDPRLAPLNIVVTVHERVATLTGFVPNRELAGRAVAAARHVPDILDVRDRLFVPNEPSGLALVEKKSQNAFTRWPAQSASWQNDSISKSVMWPSMWRPTGATEPVPTSGDFGPAILPRPAIAKTSGNTTSWVKAPPLAATSTMAGPPALDAAISNLILSDLRFSGIRFELKDAKVYLNGTVAAWSDLARLSADLKRIGGVREVVLREVRLSTSKGS